jgi:glycosyltransferase involved in cell wall biosynthesis
MGAPPERTKLIPYGVDTELFTPSDHQAKTPIFIFCGRFVSKKGPHLTIKGFW